MPNVIKYTTGTTPDGCLRKGDMSIGNNTADYGLSFYTGVEPPTGGYTIYLNKATGGPSIYVANNDTELITLTNQIAGQSYTTVNECLVYYAGQTDKVCLNRDYEGIVTDGLIFNLDAGFTPSYSRSGTTWYDVGGTNNGTLTNGPTFNSGNGGSIVFDGSDDRIMLSTTQYTTGTQPWTILFWVNFDDLTKHTHLTGVPDQDPGGWAPLAHYGAGREDYKQAWWDRDGWRSSSTSLSENTWHQVGLYYDGDNTIGFILDGQYDNATTGGGTFNPIARIGALGYRQHSNDRYFDGKITSTSLYTRLLAQTEILQNYNATKGRFGL